MGFFYKILRPQTTSRLLGTWGSNIDSVPTPTSSVSRLRTISFFGTDTDDFDFAITTDDFSYQVLSF
jgi:hypothetical protein